MACFFVALLALMRWNKRRKWELARQLEQTTSTRPVVEGPRIRLPEESATNSSHKRGKRDATVRRLNSVSTSSADSGVSGLRPRLASILSATFSYFTSSLSSVSSFDKDGEEEGEDWMGLLPLGGRDWMRDRLFSLEAVEIGKELGRGHYGVVYKATVLDGTARWPVALKSARQDLSSHAAVNSQEELLREGEIMAALNPYHENIANLQVRNICITRPFPSIEQGVAIETKEASPRLFLMIEYCGQGSLHRYLTSHRRSFREDLRKCKLYGMTSAARGRSSSGLPHRGLLLLVAWGNQVGSFVSEIVQIEACSSQIARGMKFLSSKGIIHGDLAARNVLLTNDDLTAKISDFGLSHRLLSSDGDATLRERQLPERWMAPEVLDKGRVDAMCDIWSFGILLWELFSLGDIPYKSE